MIWIGLIGQGYTDGVVMLWYAVPAVLTMWFIWSWVVSRFHDRAVATGSIDIAEFLVSEFDDKKRSWRPRMPHC